MAIWIDEHAYMPDCDDLKLYQYIYLLSEMLSRKKKMFEKLSYYEDFSIYCANRVFNKIQRGRQKESAPRIKSILNFLKRTLSFVRIDFEKTEFAQHLPQAAEPRIDQTHIIGIYRSTQDYRACEYTMCIHDLPKCVWETCKRTPYATCGDILLDIYTSVLLTILNQITLSNSMIKKLKDEPNDYFFGKYMCRMYQEKDPVSSVILFHLPPTMKNYILFLANRSKRSLSRDLSQIIQDWEPSDSLIENLLMDQIKNCLETDED